MSEAPAPCTSESRIDTWQDVSPGTRWRHTVRITKYIEMRQ